MGGGSQRLQNPNFGMDQSIDYMPSFNPLDARDTMTSFAMNSTQNIKAPMNVAGKPWNLANSGGSALGSPGSALGSPGSAFGSSSMGSALGSAGSALGAPGSALGGAAGGSKFALDMGSKSAGDLALKTGAGSGLGLANFAGMIPEAALQLGIPQALFGRYAGTALARGGSGALTGMAMGGPVGAGVGGGLGLLSGLLGGGGQRPRPNVPTMPFGDEYSY